MLVDRFLRDIPAKPKLAARTCQINHHTLYHGMAVSISNFGYLRMRSVSWHCELTQDALRLAHADNLKQQRLASTPLRKWLGCAHTDSIALPHLACYTADGSCAHLRSAQITVLLACICHRSFSDLYCRQLALDHAAHPRSCSKRPMRVDLPASTCPSTTRCSLGWVCSAACKASHAALRSLSGWYSSSGRLCCLDADAGLELPAELGSACAFAGIAELMHSFSISAEASQHS